jgi:hypothetical protein
MLNYFDEFAQNITAYIGQTGSLVTGDWVATSPVQQTIRAIILPENGIGFNNKDTIKLTGMDTDIRYAVYTETPLKIKSDMVDADIVMISGDSYKVISVTNWSMYGNFYKAIVEPVVRV